MKFLFKKLMAVCVILTVLVTGFAPSFAAYPSGQGYENGTMFNNFIEYVVANNGLFSVGTTYGNLTNPNDDFK
ncbi:MAG: hypothetical protein GX660_27135, partial [Clostridiaceae bacterium]|nr:hypothetical protein [Clostridiaceae bacterium]